MNWSGLNPVDALPGDHVIVNCVSRIAEAVTLVGVAKTVMGRMVWKIRSQLTRDCE